MNIAKILEQLEFEKTELSFLSADFNSTQLDTKMAQILQNYLTKDDWVENQIIQTPEFITFWNLFLKVFIQNIDEITDENVQNFQSLLKQLIFKTNFRYFRRTLEIVFKLFKKQVLDNKFCSKNDAVFGCIGNTICNQIAIQNNSYFFMSTKPDEYLEIDLSLFKQPHDFFQFVSFYTIFQTDFALFESDNFILSSFNVTDTLIIKVKVLQHKFWLQILRHSKLIEEFMIFENLHTSSKYTWNLFSLSIKSVHHNFCLLLGLNGNYFEREFAHSKFESFSKRNKIILFENFALTLNMLLISRSYFDKQTIERIRSSAYGFGISDFETLKHFNNDLKHFEYFLLTGFSKTKFKSNIYKFMDTKISKNFSFIGYLNKIEYNQTHFDQQLHSLGLFQKLCTLYELLPNKDSIFRLLVSVAKTYTYDKITQYNPKKSFFVLLKSAIYGNDGEAKLSTTAIRSLVSILENIQSSAIDIVLNEFLLSYELLDKLLQTIDAAHEYSQQLMNHFNRRTELAEFLNFDKLQQTLLKISFKNDDLAWFKVGFICKIIKLCLPNMKRPTRFQISDFFKLFTQAEFTFNDNSNLLYGLILKLLKINDSLNPKKQFFNFGLINFFVKVPDLNLNRRVLKILYLINDRNVDFLCFAWRLKYAGDKKISNMRESYESYNKTTQKLKNCEKIFEFVKSVCFDNLKTDPINSDVPRLKHPRMTSFLFEVSLLMDLEIFKLILLNLNLSIRQFPTEFLKNVNIAQFFMWTFITLVEHYASRENQPVFDLTMKLLNILTVEVLSSSNLSGCFHSLFLNARRFEQSGDAQLEASEIVYLVFKNLLKKNVVIEREIEFINFLTYLFIYFSQTFKKSENSEIAISKWDAILTFIHRRLNETENENLIFEFLKQISKSGSTQNINILFLRINFSEKGQDPKTTVLHMLNLMIIELVRYICVFGCSSQIDTCITFVVLTFENFVKFFIKNRVNLQSDQQVEVENFLLAILRFIASFPLIHGSIEPICKIIKDHILFPNFNLFGTQMAEIYKNKRIKIDENNIKQAILAINEQSLDEHITRNDIENANLNESKKCYIEADNYVNQSDAVPKFDVDLENAIAKMHSIFADKTQEYFEASQDYFEILKINSHVESHFLKNCLHRLVKSNFVQNKYLYPQKMNEFVYRKPSDHKTEFDPEFSDKLKFKHRGVMNSEYQKPFIKIYYTIPNKKVEFVSEYHLNLDNYFISQKMTYFKAIWVHKFTFIHGCLFIDTNNQTLNFFASPILEKKRKNSIELVQFRLKNTNKLVTSWQISEIAEIHEYKFFQKRNASEVIFKNMKSILFNFQQKQDLVLFAKTVTKVLSYKGLKQTDSAQLFRTNEYLKSWENHKMSNFRYLMLVNSYSSRSLNDFSQYPIFPVLVKSFEDECIVTRNLELPIGMIGDEKRKESFITRYQQSGSFNKGQNYNYGSHYSSPAIVLSFMIRLRPYQHGCLAIQNGVFDLADRLFFNFKSTIKNIINDISDVREIIPELYYLPAIYFNLNQFDFGKNQGNTRVHDVLIPSFYKNNAFRMIYELRKLLENNKVSADIGKWIDLIFGYNQNGDRAKKLNNVFFHLTYENCMKNIEITNDEQLEAIENQIYHFGQTPFQIFYSKHSAKNEIIKRRTLLNDRINSSYGVIKSFDVQNRMEKVYFMKKMKSEEIENGFLIFNVKKTTIVVYKYFETVAFIENIKSYTIRLDEIYKIDKIRDYLNSQLTHFKIDSTVEIIGNFKIVFGGFLDGQIVIFSIKSQKKVSEFHFHKTTVVKLTISRENQLVSLDESGIFICSNVDDVKNTITPYCVIYDFYGFEIRNIHFCHGESEFFCIFSNKGNFEIRNLRSPSKVLFSLPFHVAFNGRKMALSKSKFDHGVVSFGYVNCLVVCSYHAGLSEIVSYSFEGRIIGRYLMKEKDAKFVHVFICKDAHFCDYLFAVGENGENYLFDLPMLDRAHKIMPKEESTEFLKQS